MGDDFTNHQVFAGDASLSSFRQRLVFELKKSLLRCGFTETSDENETDRSIAIGPTGRWICIYDSYDNGDDADPLQFEQLSLQLSRFAPVVDIHMDDSTTLSKQ